MFLQSNDAVVSDTHATVGYDESVSDGPLSFRLFILLLICPYHKEFVENFLNYKVLLKSCVSLFSPSLC